MVFLRSLEKQVQCIPMQLNSTKPFLGVFAIAVFAYAIFILLSSDPLTRINRVCAPVVIWPERIVVSGVRIFSPSSVPSFERAFGTGYDTCRRWTFGILYRDEYERLRAQQETAAAHARAQAEQAGAKAPHTLPPSERTGGGQ